MAHFGKMKSREKFIKCSCHSEGMLLTKFDDEEELYVSFWREGLNPSNNLVDEIESYVDGVNERQLL